MLARQRAHHHRIGEENGRELLPDGYDFVLGPRSDLAQQRDALQDRAHLIDLLLQLLEERFEEVEFLLHETRGDVLVALPHAVDDLRDVVDVAEPRGLGRGDEVVRHAGQRRDDDDRPPLLPLGHDLDRVRHALRVADAGAAEFDDDHRSPFASSNSAFNSAAPAAPRIVLWTSATMRM